MICVWFLREPVARLRSAGLRAAAPAALALSAIACVAALHGVAARGAQQTFTHTVRFADPGSAASASVTWANYNALATLTPLWWPERVWLFLPMLALVWMCVAQARVCAPASDRAVALAASPSL